MPRSIRYTSRLRLFGWPLVAIAQGVDFSRNEQRGHARGIIALGDIATGIIAIGGVARGLIAVGGVAVGLVTVAGVGLGASLGLSSAASNPLPDTTASSRNNTVWEKCRMGTSSCHNGKER